MKKLLSLLIASLFVLASAGCGSGDGENGGGERPTRPEAAEDAG